MSFKQNICFLPVDYKSQQDFLFLSEKLQKSFNVYYYVEKKYNLISSAEKLTNISYSEIKKIVRQGSIIIHNFNKPTFKIYNLMKINKSNKGKNVFFQLNNLQIYNFTKNQHFNYLIYLKNVTFRKLVTNLIKNLIFLSKISIKLYFFGFDYNDMILVNSHADKILIDKNFDTLKGRTYVVYNLHENYILYKIGNIKNVKNSIKNQVFIYYDSRTWPKYNNFDLNTILELVLIDGFQKVFIKPHPREKNNLFYNSRYLLSRIFILDSDLNHRKVIDEMINSELVITSVSSVINNILISKKKFLIVGADSKKSVSKHYPIELEKLYSNNYYDFLELLREYKTINDYLDFRNLRKEKKNNAIDLILSLKVR